MISDASHYVALAAAYVRGALGEPTLDDATALARGAHLPELHRFKRTAQLPRVRAVLGALRGLAPGTLVDLGSGRGVFVWPLLDALPQLAITATDLSARRVQLFGLVARGGVARLTCARADMTQLPFAGARADCVTALEVLEHLPGDGPARAAREAMRVARRAVIATVPSHEDDNPEHMHLFDNRKLDALFRAAGARRVAIASRDSLPASSAAEWRRGSVDHVLNHIVVVALP